MGRTGKKVKIEDFGGPKKPASGSYFMWCNDNRDTMSAVVRKEAEGEGKRFRIAEVGKRLADAYKIHCTNEDKRRYTEIAMEKKKQYAIKLAEWHKTEKYQEYVKVKRNIDKGVKQVKTQTKKNFCDAGMPKKPPSAYFIFVQEKREETMEKLKNECGDTFKIGMIAAAIAKDWKDTLQETKDSYESRAVALKQQYDIDIEAFKQTESYKQACLAQQNPLEKKPRKPRKPRQPVDQQQQQQMQMQMQQQVQVQVQQPPMVVPQQMSGHYVNHQQPVSHVPQQTVTYVQQQQQYISQQTPVSYMPQQHHPQHPHQHQPVQYIPQTKQELIQSTSIPVTSTSSAVHQYNPNDNMIHQQHQHQVHHHEQTMVPQGQSVNAMPNYQMTTTSTTTGPVPTTG